MSEIRPIEEGDFAALVDFVRELPEGDRTFFKEEANEEAVRRWCAGEDGAHRWVLPEDGVVKGILALIRGAGWSAHVAELRLVVAAQHRRQGVGRSLARHGLTEGLRLGFEKIVVEVAADREGDITMFSKIGFRPEALLEAHIKDRAGNVRDLVVLSHRIDDQDAALQALGVDTAVAAGEAG